MKINKKARNLLIAMAIGDGHISKSGLLKIRHSLKQEGYLDWKMKLLRQYGVKTSELKFIDNNGYGAYEAYTRVTTFLKRCRKILYTPKKRVTRKILNRLDAIGISIWYMDDGSLSNKKDKKGKVTSSVLTISTCFSYEENQIIIDYFQEVWGVRFGQRKMKNHYALICGTREGRKFINIVKNTVSKIPCMQYKLNIKP